MKSITQCIALILCFFSASLLGQNDIIIGKIDSISSKILGENRKIMVYVPDNSANSIFAKSNYPVIYLLDGDAHFTSVVGMLEQLEGMTPKMMIVAIPNTNRTRDLTPTKAKPNPPLVPKGLSEQSGGGRQFLSFIEKELIPYIESNYSTAPYRMLIGHSLGGLFVMDALNEKPELFNSFISIDPSMWWDYKSLLTVYNNVDLYDTRFKNKSLYLGIANTLEEGLDTVSVRKANGRMTDHINAIFETRDVLKKIKSKDFDFKSKYYENETHGSAPLLTTYEGLRFIFDFYEFEFSFADIEKENSDLVDRMKSHYKNVSQLLGYPNSPDEAMINGMGYQLMEMEKSDLAGQFFKMNVEYYPESFNVYDSLGDYYMSIKNKDKAIESFEKALALNENEGSRKKLEQLKTD